MQDAHPTLSPIKNKQFCFFSVSLIGHVCVCDAQQKGSWHVAMGPVSSSQMFRVSRAAFFGSRDGNTGHSNAIYTNKHPRGPFANRHIYCTQNPLDQADLLGPSFVAWRQMKNVCWRMIERMRGLGAGRRPGRRRGGLPLFENGKQEAK